MKSNVFARSFVGRVMDNKPLAIALTAGAVVSSAFAVMVGYAMALSYMESHITRGQDVISFRPVMTEAMPAKSNRSQESMINALYAARKIHAQILADTSSAIDSDIERLMGSIDPANFAEAALSWDSTYQLTQGTGTHRTWIANQFDSHLLSEGDIHAMFMSRLTAMQQSIRNANMEVATSLGISSLTLSTPYGLGVDVRPFAMARREAIDKACEASSYAPFESAGIFVVSSLVGMAAQSMAQSAGSFDDKGKPTTSNQTGAMVAGFGAGLAADQLTTELIGSRKSLMDATKQLITSPLRSMKSGGKYASVWELSMFECAAHEIAMAETAMIEACGFDVETVRAKL